MTVLNSHHKSSSLHLQALPLDADETGQQHVLPNLEGIGGPVLEDKSSATSLPIEAMASGTAEQIGAQEQCGVSAADKQENMDDNKNTGSQKAELRKEKDHGDVMSQKGDKAGEVESTESVTNDPVLITSLVGHMVTPAKRDDEILEELMIKEDGTKMNVAEKSSNKEEARELVSSPETLPMEESMGIDAVEKLPTQEEAKTTFTEEKDKEVNITSETNSQTREGPNQPGGREAQTSDPATLKCNLNEIKDSTSNLQSESTVQDHVEMLQELQSKGAKLKPAACDVPIQAIDDPSAGISNEKNKNATEKKVKANATSSCQLL